MFFFTLELGQFLFVLHTSILSPPRRRHNGPLLPFLVASGWDYDQKMCLHEQVFSCHWNQRFVKCTDTLMLMMYVCHQECIKHEKENTISASESCFRLLKLSVKPMVNPGTNPQKSQPALAQAGLPRRANTLRVTSLWNARGLHSWCEVSRGLAKETVRYHSVSTETPRERK